MPARTLPRTAAGDRALSATSRGAPTRTLVLGVAAWEFPCAGGGFAGDYHVRADQRR